MNTRTKANKLTSAFLTIAVLFSLFVVMSQVVYAAGPAAPSNLTAKLDVSGVVLNWKNNFIPTNANDEIMIYRQADNEDRPALLADGISAGSTSYTDADVEADRTYYYSVGVYSADADIYSAFSNEATIKIPTPSAPTNLTATASSDNVVLKWKNQPFAAARSDDYIQIYRKEGSGTFLLYNSVSIEVTTYTDKDIKAGTTYTYMVCAYSNVFDIFSPYSNEASVKAGATEATATATTAPTPTPTTTPGATSSSTDETPITSNEPGNTPVNNGGGNGSDFPITTLIIAGAAVLIALIIAGVVVFAIKNKKPEGPDLASKEE